MLCILAGTDLKYSCSGMYIAGFSGVSAPRAVLPEAYRKIELFGRWCVFFLRPLVSGSHLFELLPEEYRVASFREMTPGMVSVFSIFLVQQRIHVRHQFTRLFSKNLRFPS